MSFDKFLKHRNIDKVVDPGTGDLPLTKSDVLKDAQVTRESQPTGLNKLVSDIIDLANQVRGEIQETINNVYETNKSDPGFIKYAQLVTQTHFDPAVLITSPKEIPDLSASVVLLKKAQRDVYKRVRDPRAPLYMDLHRLLSEAGLSLYAMDRIWSSALLDNELMDPAENGRLAKYALYKEEQYLRGLRQQNARISKNTISKISECFFRGFSDRLVRDITSDDTTEAIRNIDNTIKTLRQVDLLLGISSIKLNKNFEKFEDTISGIFTNFIKYTGQRIIQDQTTAFFSKIRGETLDFVLDIENIFGGVYCPLLAEMRDQVEDSAYEILSKAVEDSLIHREAIMIQTEEARSILFSNTQKMSKNQQFRNSIKVSIAFLENLKAILQSENLLASNISDRLIETLKRSEYDLIAKVAHLPSS